MRRIVFIQSGFQCNLSGFESFALSTMEDVDMRLLDDLRTDIILMFAGGAEARKLSDLYGACYFPLAPTTPRRTDY